MRILLIPTQDYIHHPIPSRHHYIFEELAKRGHTIFIPHFHVSNSNVERDTNCNIVEATKFPIKNPAIHYVINAPEQYRIIKNILETEDIDIVVSSNVLAGMIAIKLAKKYNIPVLFDIKDWFPTSASMYYTGLFGKLVHNVVYQITKYNLKNSNRITTVSSGLQEKINKEFKLESRVITNGVNTTLFQSNIKMREEMRKQYGISDNTLLLGFNGAIEKWYALDEIIANLNHLRRFYGYDIKLMIVGSNLFTDYNTKIKNQVKELGLEKYVIFTGVKPYEELPKYINAFDIGLMPLRFKYWQDISLPNKFFEYTSCNRYILASPQKSIRNTMPPEILDSFYKEYANRFEFYEYVIKAYKKREGLHNYYDSINGNNDFFKKYDWKNRANEMLCILEKMIN